MTKEYKSLEHTIRNISSKPQKLDEANPVAAVAVPVASAMGRSSLPAITRNIISRMAGAAAPVAGAGIAGAIYTALKPDAAGLGSDFSSLQQGLDMSTAAGQAEFEKRVRDAQASAIEAPETQTLQTPTTDSDKVKTPSTADSMPNVMAPAIPSAQIGDKDVDVAPEIKAPARPQAPAATPAPTAGPAAPAAPDAPAAAPVAIPAAAAAAATRTRAGEGAGRTRLLPLGLGSNTPSPATDSNAASGSDVSKYTHMAKPYVKRQQVKEDATEERSDIENVARPNSRREKAVKQQEIQKKIIEEKKSLAQVVKKNIEDTKKEKNNSPVIINPSLNKPETGGY